MCGICGCNDISIDHFHDDQKGDHQVEHSHHYEGNHLLLIEQDILAKNNRFAEDNRLFFARNNILVLNLLSSPGSGKTTLLERTIEELKTQLNLAVIEGDQQTDRDAERIKSTGTPVIQINTGKGCHLDAHQVGHAIEQLPFKINSVLFIENVGNLVCPALFDLGEASKVVILSVTEGEDKPLKYPEMFHVADLMLINKIDLLDYVDFNTEKCIEYARRINPGLQIIQLSATKKQGFDNWTGWVLSEHRNLFSSNVKECN